MVYARAQIHWFSGTGNALTVARWMEDDCRAQALPVELVAMEKAGPILPPPCDGRTLLIFVFPTHGFCASWLVLRYFWRFPKVPGASAFFLNTRAGIRAPFFFLPGLSGLALWWPTFLFRLRGHSIAGQLPVDMPHSWIAFFPPNPRFGVERLIQRAQSIVAKQLKTILSGGPSYRWSVWLTLPLDLAIAPVIPLYLLLGRFGLAKTLYTSLDCDNCGLCRRSCPVQAIELRDGRPYWRYTCENCMRCMNLCPRQSIQSWVTRLGLITYLLLLAGMAVWRLPLFLWFLILTPILFPLYRGLHWTLGNRALNWLLTYTSLTRLWHRYLAPGMGAKDFILSKKTTPPM